MLVKFKATYDSNHDTFRMEFIVVPVAGLAVLVNHSLTVVEVMISYHFFEIFVRFLVV